MNELNNERYEIVIITTIAGLALEYDEHEIFIHPATDIGRPVDLVETIVKDSDQLQVFYENIYLGRIIEPLGQLLMTLIKSSMFKVQAEIAGINLNLPLVKLALRIEYIKPTAQEHISLGQYQVMGVTFHDTQMLFAQPQWFMGKLVVLQRELENPHDQYAVSIYYRTTKIGFIPKTISKVINLLLFKSWFKVIPTIVNIQPDNKTILINITLEFVS